MGALPSAPPSSEDTRLRIARSSISLLRGFDKANSDHGRGFKLNGNIELSRAAKAAYKDFVFQREQLQLQVTRFGLAPRPGCDTVRRLISCRYCHDMLQEFFCIVPGALHGEGSRSRAPVVIVRHGVHNVGSGGQPPLPDHDMTNIIRADPITGGVLAHG
ncbi:uncharacterized protein UV8b_05302 [Ustilaginoidea virens]|uniref:Uncharacterized protein n=1 Tax=Ustilaginoidea virens TaxID=1159556 RepID=A0A8E5HTQ9_USTVR|nr:uncharacterized protein UV8b_05302 [Ustilaginoidea virens]QUC21059.1 hypothetical protein UV8b_05302 [Ustilaginoidea virens]